MKTPPLHRLWSRLIILRSKQKQGVAILTVLAIITLMTVLVVSFFNMAQTSKATAKGSVEIQRVTTLKDTIINLVIAQFREASKLAPAGNKPREIITWTSQPGAIRTFSGTDVSKNRLFKLYSSAIPQIADIRPRASEALITEINADNASDWPDRPDEFTDLNRPVYTSATGDQATSNATSNSTANAEGFSYPIADPRAYNGTDGVSARSQNVEGFTFGPLSGSKTIAGVDAKQGQLAMPVRWIYLLQDGTLGYLNASKEFTPLNGSASGEVSKSNPIVGRLAWWADDESCKINVNTASVPAAWDTPRTTSREDQWLAERQPLAGEYQRYPGHPATVDLCAVFYPNRRWVPPMLAALLGNTAPGGKMTLLEKDDALRIWNLAPFIVGDDNETTGSLGTQGGLMATPASLPNIGVSDDDHIFTSMDEVYFKASASKNKSLNAARNNLYSDGGDQQLEFLKRLEKSQFFLTHKSHSPEMTNQGFPRVSMFPMDSKAVDQLKTPTANLPGGVSPYDVTLGLNSTIGNPLKTSITGGNAYFFQRADPTSRHYEFYQNTQQRNFEVLRYLKALSKLPIPGYPDAIKIEPPPSSATAEDPDGLSFASKYPPAADASGLKLIPSVETNANTVTDSSDRTQILVNMLDYTRSINVQPAFVDPSQRYDGGNGQVTGICGCGQVSGEDVSGARHNSCMAFATASRSPRGSGKRYGPCEIAVILNVAGKKVGSGNSAQLFGQFNAVFNQMDAASKNAVNRSTGTAYAVEVGFIMSGFNPKHGFGNAFVSGGLGLQATGAGDGPAASAGGPLPIRYPNGNIQLTIGPNQYGVVDAGNRRMPQNNGSKTSGVLPLGSMGGPRAFMNEVASTSIARATPFAVVIPENVSSLPLSLVIDPGVPIRISTQDNGEGGGNLTQITELLLPSDFLTGLNLQVGTKSLAQLSLEYFKSPGAFPGQAMLRSMVVPHGDYRLVTTPSRVESDVYVPVANYKQSPQQFSFFELNDRADSRAFPNSSFQSTYGLLNQEFVPKFVLPRQTGENGANLTALPLPLPDSGRMRKTNPLGKFKWNSAGAPDPGYAEPLLTIRSNVQGGTNPQITFAKQDDKVIESSSTSDERRDIFSHGRRDGRRISANRGSSDPSETGDFDTGVAGMPDGPYMNYPDEGDRRKVMSEAYFKKIFTYGPRPASEGIAGQTVSPNFMVRSPVDFGSIPTGIMSRVPWQTLRFRPDPGMNDPAKRMSSINSVPPRGLPFANFCGPKDHFFLDMFWMPVVEPWSISEPFSTKGTINLNQQILPFMNIKRNTALYALMRGERMCAIPNEAAARYKKLSPSGEPAGDQDASYRRFINPRETVRQYTARYEKAVDPEGFALPFNVFRSASEICETWLVPEPEGVVTLEDVVRTVSANGKRTGFWEEHKLTGDNLRERPYANLYPRVTVRSNVFKLHMVAQTLQKATSENVKAFDSTKDSVTAEWRGSCLIERSIDPRDDLLNNKDYTKLNSVTLDQNITPKLDLYYTYRVTEVKQLTQ